MELLRHLYDQAGGGQETDTFKVISAAVTALRPFDTTATIANQESSRSVSYESLFCFFTNFFHENCSILRPLMFC